MTKRATATDKYPPAVILLVEDDLGDQILTQEAFQSVRVPHDLRIVNDGKEALDYLYRRESFVSAEQAPRPDLILLDLNMPRMNGQQVAEQIRRDPALRDIPIVVLTTSRRQEDVLRAYGRGATSFITKPLEFQRFLDAVRELEDLLRFLVGLKSLRQRTRLTSRQMVRLLRRQQQLEQLTEALFEDHMRQIEGVLGPEVERPAAVSSDAAERASMVRLVQKILDGVPAERLAAAHSARRSRAAGAAGDRPSADSGGLAQLARALDAAAAPGEEVRPAHAGAGGHKPEDRD